MTYVRSLLQISRNANHDKHRASRDIICRNPLHTSEHIVPNRESISPLQYIRSKAIIREAFYRIDERVLTHFEVHVVRFDARAILGGGHLIRVVLDRETAEPGCQALVVDVVGDSEVLVEVSGSADLPVCFVDGVEEVGEDHYDLDAAAVLDPAGSAWGGFWLAGTDPDCVVGGLEPAGY